MQRSKENLTVYYYHVTFGVLKISGITLTMAIMYGKTTTHFHAQSLFSDIYTLAGKDWQQRIKAISAIKFVLLLLKVGLQT